MRLYLLVVLCVAGVGAQLLIPHGSCRDRCFLRNDYSRPCQCDFDCETYGNCCYDFWTRCRGSEYGLVVTSKELNDFAQSLWDNDVNRISSALYSLNWQGLTTNQEVIDKAASKLIAPVDGRLDAILASTNQTYSSFIRLLDNYNADKLHAETHPVHEIAEENNFWNAISQTKVIQLTFRFLVDQGYIKGDIHAFHTVINELWFELYPHNEHSTSKSDSGFEHVMIGETVQRHNTNLTMPGVVVGFNNWVQFYQEEKAGRLDYQGYLKYARDPDLVDARFTWKNSMERGSSFFVGTSPEFDLALYTVCAVVHPNAPCSLHINGKHITIRTTTAKNKHFTQLTSAYPVFAQMVVTPATQLT